jgi:hypothetical protein
MIRFIVPTIAAAALLSAPAAACDPEDLLREYRAMCVEPVELAETMFKASALANDAKASAEFVRRADEAKKLCAADKYGEAFTIAVELGRYLGRAEQARGVTGDVFADASNPTKLVERR